MHRFILTALAALAAGAAAAQGDPTAAKAPVPPLEYRSAFEGYRPFAAEKVAPWRESNEAVKGGETKPPPRQDGAGPEPSKPAPTPHGEHR